MDAAARLIGAAKNPAIFVGFGAMDATDSLRHLAERIQAPVIMSRSGGGAIDARHPLSAGMLVGQALWTDIDLAIVVGTRFLAPGLSWG